MGAAKRRKTEIESLKAKGPKEKKQLKLRLKTVRSSQGFHFKNEAARRSVDPEYKLSMGNVVQGVNNGTIPYSTIQPVAIKHATKIPERLPREVKPPQRVCLTTGRKLTDEEFFTHALAMAQINPLGFRQPSNKVKNFKSTSLMEKLSIRMGVAEERVAPEERSERGQKKFAAQNEANARIVLDRIIVANPGKSVNWIVAKVYEAISHSVDSEWLTDLAKRRVSEGIDPKYLHASRRNRDHIDSQFAQAA
jgi:hypothetical protein